MKNEIDQTVERIGQLVDDAECLYVAKDDGTGTRPFLTVKDLKAVVNAYAKLKAGLATAKQGLELIESTGDEPAADIAQATLDNIGKE